MNKRLGEISDLAVENYSLVHIFDELELPHSLINDDEVIEAFNAGLIHVYINKKVDLIPDEYIIQDTEITQEQCNEWIIIYAESIRLQRLEIDEDTRADARAISNPIDCGVNTLVTQSKHMNNYTAKQALKEDVSSIVERLKSGNVDDLLSVLVIQNMQLNKLNERIAATVSNSDRYDIIGKFSNIQLKIMNDTRKNIMSINEIVNPKRTTFVKNATQNNILNSEKNNEIKNEKQNLLERSSRSIDNTVILEGEYVEK